MRELKTLGALGYWLLTFEVTLPFFDKAGARRDKKIGGAGEKNGREGGGGRGRVTKKKKQRKEHYHWND